LPSFDGKEAASMIFEEHVPGCLVEGIDYDAEMVAGLLEAGSTHEPQENDLSSSIETSQEYFQTFNNRTQSSIRVN
jgi:hypothetical protein